MGGGTEACSNLLQPQYVFSYACTLTLEGKQVRASPDLCFGGFFQ